MKGVITKLEEWAQNGQRLAAQKVTATACALLGVSAGIVSTLRTADEAKLRAKYRNAGEQREYDERAHRDEDEHILDAIRELRLQLKPVSLSNLHRFMTQAGTWTRSESELHRGMQRLNLTFGKRDNYYQAKREEPENMQRCAVYEEIFLK